MLNPVREGGREGVREGKIEAIRYRLRLKIFENFLLVNILAICQLSVNPIQTL